jgi:hypothetical protein
MGEEIQYSHFKQSDYSQFSSQLKEETALLKVTHLPSTTPFWIRPTIHYLALSWLNLM